MKTTTPAGMQKCVVVNPYFDWEEDRPLCLPLSDSIIYELHVKGFTKRIPRFPKRCGARMRAWRPSRPFNI
jgi:pullulanase/glycogen debranching enzyme